MTSVFVRVRLGLEAAQWHKNGDHPQDDCRTINGASGPFLSEGKIVRRYNHPLDNRYRKCGDCGEEMHGHGWIDQGLRGRIVCPGDWVLSVPLRTNGLVAHFPVKPDLFAAMFAARAVGQ